MQIECFVENNIRALLYVSRASLCQSNYREVRLLGAALALQRIDIDTAAAVGAWTVD